MSLQQIGIFHFVEIDPSLVWLTTFIMIIQNLDSIFKMKDLDSICRSQRAVKVSQIFKQLLFVTPKQLNHFDVRYFQQAVFQKVLYKNKSGQIDRSRKYEFRPESNNSVCSYIYFQSQSYGKAVFRYYSSSKPVPTAFSRFFKRRIYSCTKYLVAPKEGSSNLILTVQSLECQSQTGFPSGVYLFTLLPSFFPGLDLSCFRKDRYPQTANGIPIANEIIYPFSIVVNCWSSASGINFLPHLLINAYDIQTYKLDQ